VDSSNGDFMFFDNGVTWCRDMSWRGDGQWLNTYNMSVQVRTKCGHKVTITDVGNKDWSATAKLDQLLGDKVVAKFNKVVDKKNVKLEATLSPDGQILTWHNGQVWTRDKKHWVPCACTPDGALWHRPQRPELPIKAKPKCFFLDLGPDSGHRDLDRFLVGYYDVGHFQPKDCEVIVMDPDPQKAEYLRRQENVYKTSFTMESRPLTTAYSCEPHPTQGVEWANGKMHPIGSGGSKISVVNIQRLLREKAMPQDHVVLRMDLGGLERDMLSCLARSSASRLVDVMYIKNYGPDASPMGETEDEMKDTLELLKISGVKIMPIKGNSGSGKDDALAAGLQYHGSAGPGMHSR